ncbi:hypothetical protein SAMN04490248_10242 [Salinihabitans flavidus]|uniref:Sulfotransferase family protein n=1 Tax=Salinihabitans flavidus TaxID=569882 RepID=A0A1H8MDZ5_9RHOB|nr:hypothetical protein [Salinihabitans flavidus]SEO15543.1 hypothetical protein SAMN04490248_10242 [Salinihabitans flavidus]
MQVILHTGAHFTDENRLLQSLARDRERLGERGVSVPRPSSYRRQIRDLLNELRKAPLPPDTRETLLAEINEVENPDRLVLSSADFFGVSGLALGADRFYPKAAGRLGDLCTLFHGDEVELFMAIRNPATFLPALYSTSKKIDFDDFLGTTAPMALQWSEMISRIREEVPLVPITVWCNEDTPLIWEQILREMAGADPTEAFEGRHDLVTEIMTEEGQHRFEEYLASHFGLNEVQKRRVIAAFLDKFAKSDEVEEELDLPGWSEEFIAALTEAYDEDVFEIQRMPGVTLITP